MYWKDAFSESATGVTSTPFSSGACMARQSRCHLSLAPTRERWSSLSMEIDKTNEPTSGRSG